MAPLLDQIIDKALISVLVAGLGGWLMWPFRKFKGEWDGAMEKLGEVQKELELQRTNHLSHIEKNGEETVKALDKAVETLEKMHESQIEMTGFLKGRGNV